MLQLILTCLSNITWHRQLMPEWLWSESEGRSVVSKSVTPWTTQSKEFSKTVILEWVAFPFSRRSSQPRDGTQISHIAAELQGKPRLSLLKQKESDVEVIIAKRTDQF